MNHVADFDPAQELVVRDVRRGCGSLLCPRRPGMTGGEVSGVRDRGG
ncbi:hypothetical protein [Streptomyces sp. NPDC005799]